MYWKQLKREERDWGRGDGEMEMTERGALRVGARDGRGGNVYLATCISISSGGEGRDTERR